MDKFISGNLSGKIIFIPFILMAAMAVAIGTPVFAADPLPPATPTELDLNLLNLDGTNIDTGLLLTIDYLDSNLDPLSMNSVDDPDMILWEIYLGKSNLYVLVSAKDGTDINITVEGYEMLQITAVEFESVIGDYYLTTADSLPPALPTELDLNLLNLDGSNIDVNLLLTICYTNSDGNPECEYSTDFPPKWYWSIYNGKSNIYAKPPAKDGTDINITVEGYEMLNITAVVDGYISGDYYLTNVTPIPPTTTTTTVPTTTTTTTSTSTTTSTTTTTIGLAQISFDPDPKDFGVYRAPASDTRSFNIINSGDGPFFGAFSSFISGPNASYFTLLGSPYISVPANSYVNVDVSFNASKPGLYRAVFNLLGEDAPGIAATHTLDLFATIASPGGSMPINSCTTITSPGVYVLNQDISGSSTCIKIESNDVIFDGVGHSITGSGSNYGIYVYNGSATLTNVTVRNTTVTGWQYGMYYRNVENGGMTDNTASNNNVGIQIDDSSDNTLSNNTASSNNQYGIYLYSSSNNTVEYGYYFRGCAYY